MFLINVCILHLFLHPIAVCLKQLSKINKNIGQNF